MSEKSTHHARPLAQGGPGDEDEMEEEEDLELHPRQLRQLQLKLLVTHLKQVQGQIILGRQNS